MTRVIDNDKSVVDIGKLRQMVVDIHDVSKARIALFALIEGSFNDHVSKEILEHVLNMIHK